MFKRLHSVKNAGVGIGVTSHTYVVNIQQTLSFPELWADCPLLFEPSM